MRVARIPFLNLSKEYFLLNKAIRKGYYVKPLVFTSEVFKAMPLLHTVVEHNTLSIGLLDSKVNHQTAGLFF